MSWALLFGLAAGAYGFKALGLVGTGRLRPPPALDALVALLPAALLGALVVVQTLGDGQSLVLDARAAGVAAGAVAVARQAPFIVVIVVAAATAALLRAL